MENVNMNDASKRMQALLAGEIPVNNDFVDYALGKMRECLVRKKELAEQFQKAQENLQALKLKIVAVETEFEKYGDDVAHFDSILSAIMAVQAKEEIYEQAMEIR